MLLGAVICATAAGALLSPAQSTPSVDPRAAYEALFVRYSRGEFEEAARAFAALDWSDAAFDRVTAYWRARGDPRGRRIAVLLHFEAAMRGDADAPYDETTDRHLRMASMLAEDTAPAFKRLWGLAHVSWLHARLRLEDAHSFIHRLMGEFRGDAEVLLAHASLLETFVAPLARGLRVPSELPDEMPLNGVASSFRDALRADAKDFEARMRLAAVLVRLRRPAEALRELEQLERHTPPPFITYLGSLTAGAAHEQLDAADAAAEQYRRAMATYPEAQTGYIALMHLLQKQGDRGAALAVLDQWQAARVTGARDPWWVYWYGQFWMLEGRLTMVRSLAVTETR
jgi:tetratricopeptide (TPR) repeat protein